MEEVKQISSQILFTTSNAHPEVLQLIEDSKRMVHTDLHIGAADRPDELLEEVRFHLADGTAIVTLSYTPTIQQFTALETLRVRWQEVFADVKNEQGILPDDGCRISYSRSVIELFDAFPE